MTTNYFQTQTRPNGETFISMADDCPEWVADVVRDCHDGELPNDWRYTIIADLFAQLLEDPDDEYAGAGLVDIYNYDRAQWLADNLGRDGYCAEVLEMGGTCSSAFDLIGQAQELAIGRMLEIVADGIRANLETVDS
jgi:hypothetical protein